MRRVLALALVVAFVSPADAVIYRWVDENGTVNFDDDIERVPEDQRPDMKVYETRKPDPIEAEDGEVEGPRQAAFARRVARELGLQKTATQDPVSVLQVVGIYPAIGWDPAGPLTTTVVDEVIATTVAAARARRLTQTAASAEATVIRAATGLGIDAPPPSVTPDPPPPPPEPAPIILAPNIIVEANASAPVFVEQAPVNGVAPYTPYYPATQGPLFRPIRRVSNASREPPRRIPPLSRPAGRLRPPLTKPIVSRSYARPVRR